MTDDSKSPFDIDARRLDKMWIEQPKLARAAGVREADARHAHAQAKARLDVIGAQLTLEIRKNPGAHDLRDKPTTDEIAAAVTVDKRYQDALTALNRRKYELDVATADTTAFVDRRKALERLVELTALEFHSEREPRAKDGKRPAHHMQPGVDFDPTEQ